MRNLNILIADDDPSLATVLTECFRFSGARVTAARDGEEALRLAAGARPDAVVLDVSMPGKNGFEVCRELRAGPGGRTLPIVLLTARAADADRYWGLDAGADEYLTKPFDPATLVATVAGLVEARQRGEERNPLTKLPEAGSVARQAAELEAHGRPVAALALELDAEPAAVYRQKYGDLRLAAAIRAAAACLRDAAASVAEAPAPGGAAPPLLLGHAGDVGYSRFILAGDPAAVAAAGARAQARFRRGSPALYDSPDRERGFVAARRPDGSIRQVLLLELRSEPAALEELAAAPRTGGGYSQ